MFNSISLVKNNLVVLCYLGFLTACGGGSSNTEPLPDRDIIAPIVVSVSPLEDQIDVQSTQLISLKLNEAIINDATINIVVNQVDNLDNFIANVPMKNVVDYNDATFKLTFSPVTTFTERLRYRVTISNVKDSEKNTMATKIWYFSTIKPPVIENIQPNEIDNPITRAIDKVVIVFSEAMNQASIKSGVTMSKTGVANSTIAMTLNYTDETIINNNTKKSTIKGNATYTLPANTLLDPATEYEIKFLPSVTDANGISISTVAAPITKTFITGTTTGSSTGSGTRPAAPSNPTATVVSGNVDVTVGWVSVTGATDYNIYVSKNSSPFTALSLIHPFTGNTFTHTATLSDEYVYAITAIKNNEESKFALTPKVTPFTPLSPSDFTATAGEAEVVLNWTAVAGLVYTLEYKVNAGNYQPVNTGGAAVQPPYPHQGLTNGSEYTYRLTATDSSSQSGNSIKRATPLGAINFAATDKVTRSIVNGAIKIEWPDLSNANILHYNLYATETPTTRTNTCNLLATGIMSIGAATLVFTHDTNNKDACTNPLAWPLVYGNTYRYSLAIVNINGTEGAKLTSQPITPVAAPATPVITDAIPGNGSVELKWETITGLKYNVYQAGNLLAIGTGLTFTGTVGSLLITGLTNNTRFTFEIEAVNSNNTPSTTRASITKAPMPSIDVGSIKAISADNSITVTWGTKNIDSSVTGTMLYNIFLRKGQGTFIKSNIAVTPVIGKPNTYQTVITRLTNNLVHQLEISVISAAGNESVGLQSGTVYPRRGGSKISSSQSDSSFDEGLPINNAQPAHVCSIKNGYVWCWGNNTNGELGIGVRSFAEKPIRVGDVPFGSGLVSKIESDWESVTAGRNITCGIRKDIANNTSLWCWGSNANGKIGVNDLNNRNFNTPQFISKPGGTGKWKVVSAGSSHICAILQVANLNNLYCWGSNGNGQLGDNAITLSTVPNLVKGQNASAAFTDWLEVSSGLNHTCGIRRDVINQTTLWCWGARTAGQLGDNNPTTTAISVPYPNPVVTVKSDWTSVSAGVNQTCAIGSSDNSLYCWGAVTSVFATSPTLKHVPNQESPAANDWLKVFVGAYNSCGLKVNGKMTCWFGNYHGQLGIGSLITPIPDQILVTLPDTNWNEFALSYTSVCGLKNVSDVSCWGNGYGHKLGLVTSETGFPSKTGYGRSGDLIQPVLNGWTSVIASKYRGTETYALNGTNNELYGWGEFARGPNGVEKSFGAISVSTINWKEISQGREHTCGIRLGDGSTTQANLLVKDTLWCWGRNSTNQLGNFVTAGVKTGSIAAPTQIGTTKWQHISAGVDHTCGIKSVNSTKGALELWCWGDNSEGELGNVNAPGYGGFLGGQLAVGVTIPTGTQWSSVYAGYNRTCAITTNGKLYCWGDNSIGQLGNGDSANLSSNKPLLVSQPITGLASTTLWSKVSTGENNTCAITSSQNELYCWGYGYSYILGTTIVNTKPKVTTDSWIPLPIKDGNGLIEAGPWKDISVGGYHACALKVDESLWCWGRNAIGQLGRRTTEIDNVVSYVINAKLIDFTVTGKLQQVGANFGNKYKSVSAGPYYTCAIRSSAVDVMIDNTVECWGNNNNGQGGFIGTVWQTTPLAVTLQ